MLKNLTSIIIIVFYISLFIELFFYSIPSIVATKKILFPEQSNSTYFSERTKKIFNWSLTKKVIVFVLPMVFIYLLHAYPGYFLYQIHIKDNVPTNMYYAFYTGVFFVITGRLISHLYLINIKRIKAKSFEGFVINGMFRFTRNPGLLGLYISFLGFLILFHSTFFLLCLIIYVVHMHFKIIMEEDYLANKHGEDYNIYLQKTRRYL